MNITLSRKHRRKFGCSALALLALAIAAYAESASPQNGGHEENRLALSQEQIARAGIGLAQVQAGVLRETLSVYGMVTANPEQVQQVSARFDGVIRKINKRVGDTVKRGDTLITVEADESMRDYPITAAIDGVVTRREANTGEQTNGRTLLVIEDLSTVWVELALFPRDLQQVRVGQAVRISGNSRDIVGEGVVSYIAPTGNTSSQTVVARVPLSNPRQRWTPGQFVVGDITLSETSVPLLVSSAALQTVDGRPVIFVQDNGGFEPRPVQPGRSDSHSTEILDGLGGGETYVAKNSFILKAELGKEDAEHGH